MQFGSNLHSDFAQGLLRVVIHKARNLAPEERYEKFSPYVRVTCGDVHHTSKAIDNGGLNPIWEADNSYEFVLEGKESTILIEVYDKNILKDTLLGKTELLNLTDVISQANGKEQWIRLGRGDMTEIGVGEVCITFQYLPPITFVVEEIRSLVEKDVKPYIEATLGTFNTSTTALDSGIFKWESGNLLKLNLRGVDLQNDEVVVTGKYKGLLSDTVFGRTLIPVRDVVRPQTKQWYGLIDSAGRKTGEVYIASFYHLE